MNSHVWYRAVVSNDQVAAGQVMLIRKLFAQAITAAGDPDGACLFVISHERGPDRVHAEASDEIPVEADAVFFSPASVSAVPHLIAACGAQPSPPPERDHAELLVGHQRDWDLLPRLTH
jgi:hypothetical protein